MESQIKNSDSLLPRKTNLNTITTYFDLSYFRKIPGMSFEVNVNVIISHSSQRLYTLSQ